LRARRAWDSRLPPAQIAPQRTPRDKCRHRRWRLAQPDQSHRQRLRSANRRLSGARATCAPAPRAVAGWSA